MNVLPVRTVILTSDLPPHALVGTLRGIVGDASSAPFAGAVGPDRFIITRMKEYRAASMPVLIGSLAAAPGGGSAVRLRLRPPRVVILFMGVWLGFLAAVFALIVVAHAQDPRRGLLPLLAPVGLAIFSWFLMTSVFAAEARWALDRLLEAVPALRPGQRL